MQSIKNVTIASAFTAKEVAQQAQIPAITRVAVSRAAELMVEGTSVVMRGVTSFASKNPVAAVAITTGALTVAAPAIVTAPLLGAVGFSSTGVVGGSVAAVVQSSFGNIAAGSVFSILQSAAAGGYGVASVNVIVQAVGGVVSAGGVGLQWFRELEAYAGYTSQGSAATSLRIP